jgi:sulfur-carrier protein
MRVTVRLYANLREGHAAEEFMELQPGTSVSGIINTLKIPESTVTLIFINGCHAAPDTLLNDGDIVALFPPIGGG